MVDPRHTPASESVLARVALQAGELALLTGRVAPSMEALIAAYRDEAEQAGVIARQPADETLTEASADLLYEYLYSQCILASYAKHNQATGLYAEAHTHLSRACLATDPAKAVLHLRMAETAAAMLVAGIRATEERRARAALAERDSAARAAEVM